MSLSMGIGIDQLSFPSRVFRGPGALNELGDYCKTQGKRVFIIGGKTALAKAKEKIVLSLSYAGIEIVAAEWYGGECSTTNIHHLAG